MSQAAKATPATGENSVQNSNGIELSAAYGAATVGGDEDAAGAVVFGGIYAGSTTTGIVLTSNPATIEGGTYVTNNTAAESGAAVYGPSGTAWTLTNYGNVIGKTGNGILFADGGTVTNNGTIRSFSASSFAVGVNGASGQVVNSGTIEDLYDGGVRLFAGGVTNAAVIEGQTFGIEIGVGSNGSAGRAGTVVNNGTVASLNSYFGAGVYLAAGGSVTNGSLNAPAAQLIGSRVGIAINGGVGTVDNYATIQAPSTVIEITRNSQGLYEAILGVGLELFDGGTVRNGNIDDTSAVIRGAEFGVYIGGLSGTATGGAGTVINYGTIAATVGGYLAVPGVVLVSGGELTNFGTISAAGHGVELRAGGTVTNGQSGLITGFIGVDFIGQFGTVFDAGTIIGTGVSGFNQPANAVSFSTGADLLVVEPGAVFSGAIGGFNPSASIYLEGVKATSVSIASNNVTFTSSAGVETLALAGNFSNQDFVVTQEPGGTELQSRYITGTYGTTVVILSAIPTTVEGTGLVSVTQGDAIINQPGSSANLSNFGTLTASAAAGVYLNAGGSVTNATSASASGLISGYAAGVAIKGGGGTVVNSSVIKSTGAAGAGVVLGGNVPGALGAAASGYVETLTNTGTVSGATGVIAAGGDDTVTNAGVIIGSGGTAVSLAGGSDRLVLDAGAALQGVANGGGGSSVLELAGVNPGPGFAAQSIGTLAGIGSSFVDFDTLLVDPGATWEASGNGGSYQFTNDGTIIVSDGIVASGETLALGPLGEDSGDSGVIEVGHGGVAELTASVAAGQTIVFADPGSLRLEAPSGFAGAITSFQSGDVLDVAGGTGIAGYANGVLSLTVGSGTIALHFALANPSASSSLEANSDGDGGILVTLGSPQQKNVFSGSYHDGVVLSSASQNPATVTGSGYVGNSGIALLGTAGTAWTVTNYGVVYGSGGAGVGIALQSGGDILNHGSLAGATMGANGYGGATTVLNYGVITSAGGTGIYLDAGSTLVNAGTVNGYGGTAVQLAAGDRLVVDPGAVFNGTVAGSGSTLELAAGGYGGLYGLGTYFTGFSNIYVDAGAVWSLSGYVNGSAVTNAGTMLVDNGNAMVFGAVGGQGVIEVGSNGVAEFTAAVAKTQTFVFTDAYGALQLTDPKKFEARIDGFQPGDVIDLIDIKAASDTYKDGKLTLTDAAGKTVAVLTFEGHYTAADFALSGDGNHGTDITVSAPTAATDFWAVRA
jgi:hypothetical protein